MDDLKKYLDWKVEVNERPLDDRLIDEATEPFLYRLVRDFLRELKPSFVNERTLKSMRIFRKYSQMSLRSIEIALIYGCVTNTLLYYRQCETWQYE